MTSSIMDKKKTKSISKLLIFGFFTLVIMIAVVVYLVFFKSDELLTQKTKKIEIGSDIQICDLVNCTDDVGVSYHPKPVEPYALGKLNITFMASKSEENKDITFTYTVVDTTAPVIEKSGDASIAVGQEFKVSDYVKVTDNSGEDLTGKITLAAVSTSVIGEYSVDLSVKDSSGNEGKYTLKYSVVDFTALAPNLPGTKKVMQVINGLNRLTYVAEVGNPFGVTVGLYVGEFRKEVTFDGAEVGGVVLIPKVVQKLLADRDGKAIFIPADISEINNSKDVKLSFRNAIIEKIEYKNFLLEINTNGNKVSIANPIAKGEVCTQGFINKEVLPDYYNFLFAVVFKSEYDFNVIGNFNWIRELQEVVPFGKKMTETNGIFGISLNYFDKKFNLISKDDILVVGSSIVFMKNLD